MRGRAPLYRRTAVAVIALLACAALVTALMWNSVFELAFLSQVTLTPTSRGYKEWVAPSLPLFFNVYVFNWTNADRFPEELPNLEELGPYRFREHRRHINVSFNNQNHSVSYRTQRSWYFDEEFSNGTMKDNITIINVIAASAVYRSRHWGFIQQKGLSMGLAMLGQGFSVTRTAEELFFEGYEDPFLDIARILPSTTTGGAPPVDRFGLFYERNNSMDTEGLVEVATGEASGTYPGQILRWNNYESLPFYEGACSQITGSAGEMMAHNLTEEPFTLFVPDLCRTVHLEYNSSGSLDGVLYNKYTMTEASFDNSSRSPDNACFCSGECSWSGTMNVSACRYGSPAFMSLPHFLYGDPELRSYVTGLSPDPELHSFYFAIEPRLGVPVDVAGRFQFNIFIEPTPNIALYENVPRMMFPVFWVEQKVQISPEVLSELRSVRAVLERGGAILAGVAVALAALALALLTCCSKTSKYTSPQEIKEKDEAEVKLNPM
ncbi:protein peste-like [Danaus plexippus]|nr:protein peste-like [Danaus plexippus]